MLSARASVLEVSADPASSEQRLPSRREPAEGGIVG